SVTENVAMPLALDVAVAGEMVELPSDVEARVTDSFATGFAKWSNTVTVTVEAVDPSAATWMGLAPTCDCAASPWPATKVTDAVCAIVNEPTDALNTTGSACSSIAENW